MQAEKIDPPLHSGRAQTSQEAVDDEFRIPSREAPSSVAIVRMSFGGQTWKDAAPERALCQMRRGELKMGWLNIAKQSRSADCHSSDIRPSGAVCVLGVLLTTALLSGIAGAQTFVYASPDIGIPLGTVDAEIRDESVVDRTTPGG